MKSIRRFLFIRDLEGELQMAQTMTQGSISRILVRFSLPLIFSGVLQQLYNWADAFIVGNVEGELALAAVGATTSTVNLFLMVITGVTLGLSILSAQRCGQGRAGENAQVLSTFVLALGGCFLVLSAAGIFLAEGVLRMLHTPADIRDQAAEYLHIVLLGVPFLAVYNVYSAVLRGMGDSRAPFLSVLVSSAGNVALDLLFVARLGWGVAGAAAATVLSQLMMTLFLICYTVRRYAFLRFRPGRAAFSREALRRGLRLGIPPAVQSGVTSLGNFALQNFMNGFGTAAVAAITTAYQVDSIIMLPMLNLGSGISTVAAQNIGAGDRRRAWRAFLVGSAMTAAVSLLLAALVYSAGGEMITMFGVGPESAAIGRRFFREIAPFYLIYGLSMSSRGFLEGLGDVNFSSAAGIASLAVRIAASYGAAGRWGTSIIAYAEVLSWSVLLLLCLLRIGKKRSCG